MYQAPVKSRLPEDIRRQMPPGLTYLGEDPNFYYFAGPGNDAELGGFFDGLGNMFKRMVKFTPKSFTPGNLYKGFINTTLGVASGGLIYALPKNIRKSIYNVGKIAVPVIAAGVGAYYLGPSVMSAIGPKLASAASMLGKNVSTIGGNLMSLMQKLSPSQQAAVAEQITPEQVAKMETAQQVPPELVPMFQHAMAASLPQGASGAASLYDPQAMAERDAMNAPTDVAQAGMTGANLPMLALLGVPLLFAALQSRTGR